MNDSSLGFYLLADGTHARPTDCEPDADGVLRHIYGMAVALDGDGEPMTVGRGAVDNKNVLAVEQGGHAPADVVEEPVADVVVEAEPIADADEQVSVVEADDAGDEGDDSNSVASVEAAAAEPASEPQPEAPGSADREMKPAPAPKRHRKPGYKTRRG